MAKPRDVDGYAHLWNGTEPGWCLLEARGRSEPLIFDRDAPQRLPRVYWRLRGLVRARMRAEGVPYVRLGMALADPVRQLARWRGLPDAVVRGGLAWLLTRYEQLVDALDRGDPMTLEQYLRELDGRYLIDQVLAVVPASDPARPQLAIIDARLRAMLSPDRRSAVCCTRDRRWYDLGLPPLVARGV